LNDAITLTRMKEVCRKGGIRSSRDPFWLMKYGYRPWTIYVTWVFAKTGITANGVSFLSGVVLLASAILYGLPWPAAWIWGAVGTQVYFVLDMVDGELGRFQKEALGRRTGISGHFCDTACHAGMLALYAMIAMRLYVDMGEPWWLLVMVAFLFFPGSIGPWQRYCEAVVKHGEAHVGDDGNAAVPARFLSQSSWAAPQLDAAGHAAPRPLSRRLLSVAMQSIGYPGLFVTLFACTLLDAIEGAPHIVIAGLEMPWLFWWLAVKALHATASGLKSSFVYARRLHDLR
jgi:phosphatidylglycerophosphate synthase